MKLHYLIYQIRNKLNGMIYVGQHKTNNINDSYTGSGVYLNKAIEKYGLENFEKTILFECQSEEEMNAKEAEIVNEDFIARDDTYNVVCGGEQGSWKRVHEAGLHRKGGVNAMKSNKLKNKHIWTDFWNSLTQEQKILWKQMHPTAMNGKLPSWKGRHHTEETKKKMSLSKKGKYCGKENSMFGKRWIMNIKLQQSKVISKDDPLPDGWIYGRCRDFSRYQNTLKQSIANKQKKQEMLLKRQQEMLLKRQQEKQKKREEFLRLLNEMRYVYENGGFDAIVKKFEYKHTRNNLVQQFRKYIPGYEPKKWKRKTKNATLAEK